MSRRMLPIALPLSAALAVLCGLRLSAGAQEPTPPRDRPRPPAPAAVERAKEMAALIQQGQLGLRDATALAEGHTRGVALQVRCRIERGAQPPTPVAPRAETPPRGPFPQEKGNPAAVQPAGDRLIYEVSCYARDQVVDVQVDGATKTVIGAAGYK